MDFFGASRSFAGFLIFVTVGSIDDASLNADIRPSILFNCHTGRTVIWHGQGRLGRRSGCYCSTSDGANLLTSLVLAPLAPTGVKAGYLILKNIDTRLLYRILYLLLFVSGLKLVIASAA